MAAQVAQQSPVASVTTLSPAVTQAHVSSAPNADSCVASQLPPSPPQSRHGSTDEQQVSILILSLLVKLVVLTVFA